MNDNNDRRETNPRSRIVAAFLALVGGFIGLHKLYLRDTGGMIMFFFLLIFSINVFKMPLTFLLGVLDAFKLLGMSDDQFNQKYNRGIIKPKVNIIDQRREEQMRRYQTEGRSNTPSVAQRTSSRSNPFKKSGMEKYKEFDLEGAIADFKQGIEISPDDIALHFNLACAYSLTEKKDLAFDHISKAVGMGFSDYERIISHDDLAFLRIQPEFESFKSSGFRKTNAAGTPRTVQSTPVETDIALEEAPQNDVLLAQLSRLAELKNRGILSEDEFVREKQKLMRR